MNTFKGIYFIFVIIIMSDDKIDLIKLIQETFSSREKDPNIKSVKIISDALDKCTEEDVNYENEKNVSLIYNL